MKNWKSRLSTLFTVTVIGVVLYRQAPVWLNNFNQSGKKLESKEYPGIDTSKVVFPPSGKAVAIFWASWCGPCKVEMARLKSSVDSGAIPRERIIAINPYETMAQTKKFLAETPYPFTFIDAPEISSELSVQQTPTTILLEDGSVSSMSSGMSLIGIWRAEIFLD